jgi:hypothetical protein
MATTPRYQIKPTSKTISSGRPGISVPTERSVQDPKQLKFLLQNIIENLHKVGLDSGLSTQILNVLTGGSGNTGDIPAIPDVNVFIQDTDPGARTYPYFWIAPGINPPDTTSLILYVP